MGGQRMSTRVLRPALACCKLYISEARNAPAALRAVAVLVNAFANDAYNRVEYKLVSRLSSGDSDPPPLHHAAFAVVTAAAALEAVDFGSHAGAHPRLDIVDHATFHPLARAHLNDV